MPASKYSKADKARLTTEIAMLKQAGRTWNEVEAISGVPRETGRTWWRRMMAKGGPPIPEVDGAVPDDYVVDGEEALARAMLEWQRTEALMQRQEHQVIRFPHGPVGITFLADQHLGSDGVDYSRCFEEVRLITSTPGMYIGLAGDFTDNYVISRLMFLQTKKRLAMSDEAALLQLYLETVAPRLLCVVPGNHDWWTSMLTGIDQIANALSTTAPQVLYDPDQLDVAIVVGDARYPGRIRHKWRYYSMYNASHGIEQSYRQDAAPFVWAVGAHLHISGLVREFNAGGETGIALVLGSYREYDTYAKQMGFPEPNRSTAVTLIFDEHGMRGESNLNRAVDFFQSIYGSNNGAPVREKLNV